VKNMIGLVVIRFFFGIAEAGITQYNLILSLISTIYLFSGFSPGIVFYLTLWFTKQEQAVRMGLYISATAFCGLFGGLLAYGILQMEGIGGLRGWQWLFLLEGFPSVVAGVVVWFVLPNSPSDCKWLNEKERLMATRRLEGGAKEQQHVFRLRDAVATLKDPRVVGCAFVYFTIVNAFYTIAFFLPALMTDFGFSSLDSNLMSSPAYFFAAAVMLANSYHSDKTKERAWHVVIPGVLSVFSWGMLACACALRNFAFELVACFCVMGSTWAMMSPILAWLMDGLHGVTSSAVGAAFVIAIGNILIK
jgi:MFS family permease